MTDTYQTFLDAKVKMAEAAGFEVPISAFHSSLQDRGHQAIMARWMVGGGRRALFASFGLGKGGVQQEVVRVILALLGGALKETTPRVGTGGEIVSGIASSAAPAGPILGLIVHPLGVRQEFFRDAERLGTRLVFVRSTAEVEYELAKCGFNGVAPPIFCTNYESIREGKLDVSLFTVASLDEADILRGFGGSKTFRELLRQFECVPYRFVATATPAPNEFEELLAYAHFLGVMDIGEAKTRFFKRNSEQADSLTLHPHKVREFWLWVASWALFVTKPSDLGCSDAGYDMPPLRVIEHEIGTRAPSVTEDKFGQGQMLAAGSADLVESAREKRRSLGDRVEEMTRILGASPDDHFIIWHDLEDERLAIEAAIPGAVSVYGSQDLEEREQAILIFADGWLQVLAAKPVIAGAGCNLQRHCHKAVFLGIGHKFKDFIQAVHRIVRFLQDQECEIHLIFTEAERPTLRNLMRKWEQHDEMGRQLSAIVREYGLASAAMAGALQRSMGVERVEVTGAGYTLVNNDTVVEAATMPADSVDLIVTSIPFSTQYEYTPSFNDFGHTDDDAHFWRQMDFLMPNLLRVLKPGRDACIHVKDRIVPGGMTGLGFQTVGPFSDDCVAHFRKHGFAFLGRITIATDVVRENNQTYRLGWSEQCKDGTRQGAGLPEYLLVFRKPPSDRSNGYADTPVEKSKAEYTRGRWQVDAAGFWRSSGDRLMSVDELAIMESAVVYRIWREHNLAAVYDHEHHVRIGERLELVGRLPPDFALIPAHSWHPQVWSDITRMRTLNGVQHAKGKEMHLCPLQFDVVERCVRQRSMPGELVFDPFGGLMTVPYIALKLGRRGLGVELSPGYFRDGCAHVAAMAREIATPSLFGAMDAEAAETAEVAA
jgi:DNA modification methylase